MTSVSDGSRTTTYVALRILGGEKPADIESTVLAYGPAKYDWRQLQRAAPSASTTSHPAARFTLVSRVCGNCIAGTSCSSLCCSSSRRH